MIDAKKIVEAAIQNADKYNPDRSTLDREEVCRASFEDGVEWLKQALWHDAKEEPDKHKFVLVQWFYMGRYGADMIKRKYYWQGYIEEYHIIKWCYIDDLLPKGGDK